LWIGPWEETQQQLRDHEVSRNAQATNVEPRPLTGKLFDDHGECLTPSHAVKRDRRHR